MAKRVYLYAFDYLWKIVDTRFLEGDEISVRNILQMANWMKLNNTERVVICAIDNRPGLRKEFMESVRSTDFTKRYEFADMVYREGIPLK